MNDFDYAKKIETLLQKEHSENCFIEIRIEKEDLNRDIFIYLDINSNGEYSDLSALPRDLSRKQFINRVKLSSKKMTSTVKVFKTLDIIPFDAKIDSSHISEKVYKGKLTMKKILKELELFISKQTLENI